MKITKLIMIAMLTLLVIFAAVAASTVSFDMCKKYDLVEQDEVEYRLCPYENFSELVTSYPERCRCVCQ